jgi:hypothetical protein
VEATVVVKRLVEIVVRSELVDVEVMEVSVVVRELEVLVVDEVVSSALDVSTLDVSDVV